MLNDFKQVKNFKVILLTLNKSYFLSVKTVRICMNVKTSKVLIFFIENIVTWITEPRKLIFITIKILQQNHNNYSPWQYFKTFKTQIMKKTRALFWLEPHGSVTEWITHEASDMLTYREKSSSAIGGRFFISCQAIILK